MSLYEYSFLVGKKDSFLKIVESMKLERQIRELINEGEYDEIGNLRKKNRGIVSMKKVLGSLDERIKRYIVYNPYSQAYIIEEVPCSYFGFSKVQHKGKNLKDCRTPTKIRIIDGETPEGVFHNRFNSKRRPYNRSKEKKTLRKILEE